MYINLANLKLKNLTFMYYILKNHGYKILYRFYHFDIFPHYIYIELLLKSVMELTREMDSERK
jgi:hypothetical protein